MGPLEWTTLGWWVREILALVGLSLSVLFGLLGLIGLYRFPDAWSRLQASSLASATSVFSLFLGCLALAPSPAMASRILIITGFFLVSSPTGSHIVARFLWESGIPHWKPQEER